MSFCRSLQLPVTSSVTRIVSRRTSFHQCSHSLRSFSSGRQPPQSSKRELQTATAYRPHSLPTPFPASWGAGTSDGDGSVTASIPGLDTTPNSQHPQSTKSSDENNSVSLSESEAQKSKPATSGAPATDGSSPQTSAPKPRRSKLRARKAAMTITPAAISQLRELVSQPDPRMIRVGVKNKGCSGLAYHLEYVEKPGKFDEAVEQEGVKVLVDSKALFSIIGSEMDWEEDKLSSRFVFKNPNIKDECGCGESFMV